MDRSGVSSKNVTNIQSHKNTDIKTQEIKNNVPPMQALLDHRAELFKYIDSHLSRCPDGLHPRDENLKRELWTRCATLVRGVTQHRDSLHNFFCF